MNEANFWIFDRTDIKNAITCLWLNDLEEMDDTAIKMKELISKHFKNEKELADWSRTFFDEVKRFYLNRFSVRFGEN